MYSYCPMTGFTATVCASPGDNQNYGAPTTLGRLPLPDGEHMMTTRMKHKIVPIDFKTQNTLPNPC